MCRGGGGTQPLVKVVFDPQICSTVDGRCNPSWFGRPSNLFRLRLASTEQCYLSGTRRRSGYSIVTFSTLRRAVY